MLFSRFGFLSEKIRLVFAFTIIALLLFTGRGSSAPFKVIWEQIDWQILQTRNFDIYFPKGYENLARTTHLYAEEANLLLSGRMHHHLSQVIPIFIYPSHGHFQGTNIIPFELGEGIGGFTERIKKRVVVPFLGSYDDYRHVLTHELVHAFQYDILLGSGFSGLFASQYGSNPPLWLVEGMAEYFSLGWEESVEMMMRDAVVTDTLPGIIEMTQGRVANQFIFYKGGQAVMNFIAETWGEYRILELLKDFRDQRGLTEAIRVNFGIEPEEFDKRYKMWVRRRFAEDARREFDHEAGRLISDHLADRSFMNLHPVISPDGKSVVYLSIRNFYPAIVWRKIDKVQPEPDYRPEREEEDPDEEILIQAGNNAEFYQLNMLSNRISFTPDSKKIFLSIRSGGHDRLILFDIEEREVLEEWVPPLDMVMHPQLSPDGTMAVFSGTISGQTDLYILNLQTKDLQRVTNDYFTEKDGAFSKDNNFLLYSVNRDENRNPESSDYHIYEMNLQTGESVRLTRMTGKSTNPSYYRNADLVFFTSNTTGISNFYLLDRTTSQVHMASDVQSGVFNASFDANSETMAFGMYRFQGYDISVSKAPAAPNDFFELQTSAVFERIRYPEYFVDSDVLTVEPYRPKFSPDFLFFGFQYSTFFGFGGFLQMSATDYTGNHSIFGFVDYLSNREAMNFSLSYAYLKKKVNFYVTAYRTMNYFSIFNLTNLATINDFLYFPPFIQNSVRFGGTLTAEYPLSPFLAIAAQLELSRYEEVFRRDFADNFRRPDIYSNITSLNYAVTYNNVLYTIIGPLTGWHFRWVGEQTLNLSGNDFVYNRQTVDLRTYFHLGQRYILAGRLWAGTVNGPQRDFFPWQIGGFNSLRGFEFLSLKGSHSFVTNFEFRFPFLDAILFGFPVPWIIQGFSGVFFIDFGTAYDSPSSFKGISNGRLVDLKMSYGLGGRMILFPGLFLKIDWGTPWDWQSSLPISKWAGIFSIGYEF